MSDLARAEKQRRQRTVGIKTVLVVVLALAGDETLCRALRLECIASVVVLHVV